MYACAIKATNSYVKIIKKKQLLQENIFNIIFELFGDVFAKQWDSIGKLKNAIKQMQCNVPNQYFCTNFRIIYRYRMLTSFSFLIYGTFPRAFRLALTRL